MTTRPRTAQAQRGQIRPESSIPLPLPRTKSIPILRRPQTRTTTSTSSIPPLPSLPPLPLGLSRTQSQVPLPRQGAISRKPSIPLRPSGLARKVSTTRLRSPAPSLPVNNGLSIPVPVQVRGRERKPLPTRSLLPIIPPAKTTLNSNTLGSKRGPPSPSINSIPVVNRLNRKASVPILPRAGYIAAPIALVGNGGKNKNKRNVVGVNEIDDDNDNVFQGGRSIVGHLAPMMVQKKMETEIERPPIQRMVQRGIPSFRPDYLEEGMDLHDMSLDLNGTPSPTKPDYRNMVRSPISAMPNHEVVHQRRNPSRMNQSRSRNDDGDDHPSEVEAVTKATSPFLAQNPSPPILKTLQSPPIPTRSFQFDFSSPIRPPRLKQVEGTPVLPRWPKQGHVINLDNLPMISDESFGFTGDSLEMQCPPSGMSTIFDPSAKSRKLDIPTIKETTREAYISVEELTREMEIGMSLTATTDGTEKARLIQEKSEMKNELARLSQQRDLAVVQRDEALSSEEAGRMEVKERRYGEVKRGIEDELERCMEYREWLESLKNLIRPQRG